MGNFVRVGGTAGAESNHASADDIRRFHAERLELRRGGAVQFTAGGDVRDAGHTVVQAADVNGLIDGRVWVTPGGAPIVGRGVRMTDLVTVDGMQMTVGMARSLGFVAD